MTARAEFQRLPAEKRFADELEALARSDTHIPPQGWRLSPLAVESFVLGDESRGITRKFVADPAQVRRIIVSLCTGRGCFLIGPPGTAKSWFSELVAAAVSGNSTLTVQGSAIANLEQLLYGWNSEVLARQGPCMEALVPGPLLRGMRDGQLVRFEELSRCPQALQDAILSVLSERVILIPEIDGDEGMICAREGFNIIATSNNVDEGVKRMSAALKRRMNFELISPIRRVTDEIDVVMSEVGVLVRQAGLDVNPDPEIVEVLVTLFHELRTGLSLDGRSTHRLAGAALSTAEAINVAHAMMIHAWYYTDGRMRMEDLLPFIIGAALKDKPEDRRRLKYYLESEAAQKKASGWATLVAQRNLL